MAAAQQVPAIEVSGAYQFSPKPHSYNGDISDGLNRHGWAASLVRNFDDVFGLEFNTNGSYGKVNTEETSGTAAVHGFMGGPRFSYREKESFAPYGRALVGLVHRKVSGVSDSFLAAQLGGGLTLFTSSRMGLVAGGDYRRNWHGLKWDDFTVYVGISFRKRSE